MPNITVRNTGQTIQTTAAVSILNTLLREGVKIKHVCGGKTQCGTCRIRVIEGHQTLSPILERERIRLDALGTPKDVRLACQTHTYGDITIDIILYDSE